LQKLNLAKYLHKWYNKYMENPRIAIVEDDTEHQRLLLSAFELEGVGAVVIACASNMAEAEKIIEKEEFDVIIVDGEFPHSKSLGNLPGVFLVQLMRERYPNTKVVWHSSHKADDVGVTADHESHKNAFSAARYIKEVDAA
jgi:CheY-like chemotaxis protein